MTVSTHLKVKFRRRGCPIRHTTDRFPRHHSFSSFGIKRVKSRDYHKHAPADIENHHLSITSKKAGELDAPVLGSHNLGAGPCCVDETWTGALIRRLVESSRDAP